MWNDFTRQNERFISRVNLLISVLIFLMFITNPMAVGSKDKLFVWFYNIDIGFGKASSFVWVIISLWHVLAQTKQYRKAIGIRPPRRMQVLRGVMAEFSLMLALSPFLFGSYIDYHNQSNELAYSFDYCTVSTVDNLKVYATPQVTEKYKEDLADAMLKLPDGLMRRFGADGWDLILYTPDSKEGMSQLSKLLSKESTSLNTGNLKGLTVPAGRKIIIFVGNNHSEEEFKRTFLHEMGHYFETLKKPTAWGEKVAMLPSMEKWVGYNESELFAEIFSNLCYDDRATYMDTEEPAYLAVKQLISDFK